MLYYYKHLADDLSEGLLKTTKHPVMALLIPSLHIPSAEGVGKGKKCPLNTCRYTKYFNL